MITKKPRIRKVAPAMDVAQTPTGAPVADPMTFHEHLHHHRSTRVLLVVLGIILVIVAILGVWWQFFRSAPTLSPEETLQSLRASSEAVTTTPAEQAADLSQAGKNSVQYQITTEDRLNTLKALNK